MQTDLQRHRWLILAALCLGAFVVLLDATIVNVALPSLALDLDATTTELQWFVDSYNLVFASLLLAAGTWGDRFGRRRSLALGLVLFAATSIGAATAESTGALIAWRGLMGVGAALVFPATLAILTTVFKDPRERSTAIGVWGAVSGVAVAVGPIAGGALLEHYWWGAVFLVNLPIAVVGLLAVVALIPTMRTANQNPIDLIGAALSILASGALVLTIIEAPEWGWTSGPVLAGFTTSACLGLGFIAWELHAAHPLLPVRIFKDIRFTAASVAETSVFFALLGFVFLATQYLQLLRGYTPFEAGLRVVPIAVAIAAGSVLAPWLVARHGTTRVVAGGLLTMTAGFAWVSTLSTTTPYLEIASQMTVLGLGLGLTSAPATESIMGSVPPDQAGVGSAVNDTTRELGGTLGIAVVGSVFNSTYQSALSASPVLDALPSEARAHAQDSVAAATQLAHTLDTQTASLLRDISEAFLQGLETAAFISATVTLSAAIFVIRFLPAHKRVDEVAHPVSPMDVVPAGPQECELGRPSETSSPVRSIRSSVLWLSSRRSMTSPALE